MSFDLYLRFILNQFITQVRIFFFGASDFSDGSITSVIEQTFISESRGWLSIFRLDCEACIIRWCLLYRCCMTMGFRHSVYITISLQGDDAQKAKNHLKYYFTRNRRSFKGTWLWRHEVNLRVTQRRMGNALITLPLPKLLHEEKEDGWIWGLFKIASNYLHGASNSTK